MFLNTVSSAGWSEVVNTAKGSVCGCKACALPSIPGILGHLIRRPSMACTSRGFLRRVWRTLKEGNWLVAPMDEPFVESRGL